MAKKSAPHCVVTKSAEDKAREARWEAESDLRTCTEYHRIRKDPKRMAAVRKMAKEQVASLKESVGE